MKKTILLAVSTCMLFMLATSASAQCDRNLQSPIRCGYYDEGYQDGAEDARNNRANNYRRYQNKFERQYEDFYRDGYNAGYDSIGGGGSVRWTSAQRNAYDGGYTMGENDRRYRTANPSAGRSRYTGQLYPYFEQGYNDAFANRPRRYDFAIGSGPGFPERPGPGTATGTATWDGRVDNRARIFIRGNSIWSEDLTNSGLDQGQAFVNGSLPRRAATVSVQKLAGRGTAYVVEQPNRNNNFTAAIEISDTRAGADDYRLQISWRASAGNETYSPGSVTWRGRVDDRAQITISGSDVWAEATSGSPVTGDRFDINGYLAARPATVRVAKRSGRGTVRVIEQPSRANGFNAVIEIYDPQGSADDYEINVTW